MAGVRIDSKPPLPAPITLNIRGDANELGQKFASAASALNRIQDTFNKLIEVLSKWSVGEVTRLILTDTTGKQIGWLGLKGNDSGLAINTIRAYSNGSHLGVGMITAPAQVTGSATNLLTVSLDDQVQVFDFAAGGGAYTYNIDLDTVGAFEGAVFYLKITKAASTNPTIVVRDGSGGSTLVSLNNGNAENYGAVFVFDGANWVKLVFAKNDI